MLPLDVACIHGCVETIGLDHRLMRQGVEIHVLTPVWTYMAVAPQGFGDGWALDHDDTAGWRAVDEI